MIRIITFLLLLPLCLFGRPKSRGPTPVEGLYEPWFTGPFLAPSATNADPKHPIFEIGLIAAYNYAEYTPDWGIKSTDPIWVLNPFVYIELGITERFGIEAFTGTVSRFQRGNHSTNLQDTVVQFGYQVLDDQKDTPIPNFRLYLSTIFPSGSHDELDPSLEGIDVSGDGAYFIGPTLSFEKHFYLPCNYFSLQWSFAYLFPTRADIHRTSVYGGTKKSRGSIRPGQTLIAFISGEYSFNQRWVFAFDTLFNYQRAATDFRGKPGFLPSGRPAPIGLPSSARLSFAPALEYNFSASNGIIFGTWFSIIGRNRSAFASLIAAWIYTF